MEPNNFAEIEQSPFDIKKEFFKYLFYWKYFLAAITISLLISAFYIRYTSKVYESTAKIKILDKKDSALEMPSAEDLFASSKINLENEKELILSYPILEKVVKSLDLNLSVYAVGDIKNGLIAPEAYPFTVKSRIKNKDIFEMEFRVELTENGIEVVDPQDNDKTYLFNNFTTTKTKHPLPFNIYNVNKNMIGLEPYIFKLTSTELSVKNLKKRILLKEIGKESEILAINYNSTNISYAKNIINELIDTYNQDGIIDRQLIHKRTIDFVNARYILLESELDSIEYDKQRFKQANNLVDIQANATISLEKSAFTEGSIFDNENQIFVTNSLLEELAKLNFELLPSNIGIESVTINNLISIYNEKILEYKKIIRSAGPNNPITQQIEGLINDSRVNIIFSLQTYFKQLNTLKEKQIKEFNKFDDQLKLIPANEKNLRSINRNQETKEALYLFLLQKREEAEVSFAVTEPSIKVVEYAISKHIPLSPKAQIIYLGAILLGLLIPFFVIYLIFLFNTKIQTRDDIEESSFKGTVLAEIPFFDLDEKEKTFSNPSDRSIVSESFRMLMSNTRYLLKSEKDSSVILVTSSIKGEGKTLTALNLSLAFASLDKKVLLIGCDLRNPQLHKYVNEEKDQKGVVNFLVDNKLKWHEWTLKKFNKHPTHEILLCGSLPPNPLNLINNGSLDVLIEQAKKVYDYVIIDTAPTLLVADTKSILKLADAAIYLTRCNVTDKEILNHINDSSKETNLGLVLNGVGEKNAYGYSYGYKYGYGYKYKYSYNYGYGYGYNEDKD